MHPPIQPGNAKSVRSLIDNTKGCISALEVLSTPTQHWDGILLWVFTTKLDSATRQLWEQSLPNADIPDISKMYEFLGNRARALAGGSQQQHPLQIQHQRQPEKRIQAHHVAPSNGSKCKVGCAQFHPIYKCPTFKQNTPQQRLEVLKRNNLCFNCFMNTHGAQS